MHPGYGVPAPLAGGSTQSAAPRRGCGCCAAPGQPRDRAAEGQSGWAPLLGRPSGRWCGVGLKAQRRAAGLESSRERRGGGGRRCWRCWPGITVRRRRVPLLLRPLPDPPGAKGGASRGRGWLRRRRPPRAPSPDMSPNYMRSFSEGCVSTRGRTWGRSREPGARGPAPNCEGPAPPPPSPGAGCLPASARSAAGFFRAGRDARRKGPAGELEMFPLQFNLQE